MNTTEKLKHLIHQEYDIDPAAVDADQPFASYNVDSLTLAELLFAIEDKFEVVVPDEALSTVTTLSQLAIMLDGLLAAKNA
ncbi:MAG: acyl carrier protein [Betaproteobacteria bacterium]